MVLTDLQIVILGIFTKMMEDAFLVENTLSLLMTNYLVLVRKNAWLMRKLNRMETVKIVFQAWLKIQMIKQDALVSFLDYALLILKLNIKQMEYLIHVHLMTVILAKSLMEMELASPVQLVLQQIQVEGYV